MINPYNGCEHHCCFCYAHAFPGYFARFRKTGEITVFEDFDKVIEGQLDKIRVASCLDIPRAFEREIYGKVENGYGKEMRRRYEQLYVEEMSGRRHARVEYRRKLFGEIKALCDKAEVTRAYVWSLKR